MWNVVSDGNGNLQLIPVGEPIPDGWTIEAVTANPNYLDPVPPQRVITKYQFRMRFTFAEREGIDTSTDTNIIVLRNDFNAAEEIDLDNPEVSAALDYFELQGLIAPGRAAEILA
jgi:hypothetical protein